MRIVVFGATGPTGLLLTRQALDRGYSVTAVSRRPDEYPFSDPALDVVRADVTNPAQVASVIAGANAVASVLGVKYSKDPITLYSDSARAFITAMREQGIDRLVVTSSSAADPWVDPTWSWGERNIAHRILDKLGATLYADMRAMEAIVAGSGLDWTIMRPLGLANMEPPTEYAVAVDHIPGRQTARRDLAAAILDEIDPTTNPTTAAQHQAGGPARTAHHQQRIAVATTNKTLSLPATIWREGIRPQLTRTKTGTTPGTTSVGTR